MVEGIEADQVDLDEIREKYRRERDRRVGQSSREAPELVGTLARFLDDPFTSLTPREPVFDHVDVTVVGAGLGGLMVGANLKMRGIARVRHVDLAADVGGVWYWNRYPGAMCDIESLIYMPLLEETGYVPTMRYAGAVEIQAHARRIAEHYGLYNHSLFQTQIEGIRWDDRASHWILQSNRGDEFTSQYVVLANGPLSRLKLPDLDGIENFTGHSFHTSRWDFAYTGGTADTPMVNLVDKKVGIIGTGATALQCVPPLGRDAGHLFVFQRTPSTVGVRDNRPIEPDSFDRSPGWQRRRQRNFTRVLVGAPVDEDLVKDGWTDLYGHLIADPYFKTLSGAAAAKAIEIADFNKMESVRKRIAEVVADPDVAESLKPYYRYLCKRPGFHDEYLETFNRPNVTLVDTGGAGLDRAYSDGVVVRGEPYELDLLIFATGFEYETSYSHRIGFEIVGDHGITLTEKWAKGMSSMHGLFTNGFPNLAIMSGVNTQSTITSNFIDTMQENAEHVSYIIAELFYRKAMGFEVSKQAEDEWVQVILDRAIDRRAFLESCTPGRANREGQIVERPKQNTNFGGSPLEYFEMLANWRDSGELPGLIVR